MSNEIIVKIDASKFTQQDFQIIQQLPQILQDSGGVGEFELGNLMLKITQLNEHQNELINL